MFRRQVMGIDELLGKAIRENGLEGPLLEKRTLAAWDKVVGPTIARMTAQKYIRNQTLFVKITNPALRQDLSMMQTRLRQHIVEEVGSKVVIKIAFV